MTSEVRGSGPLCASGRRSLLRVVVCAGILFLSIIGGVQAAGKRATEGAVVVRSTGVGESVVAAQQNALQNAVLNATGALVVTERRVEEERLKENDISYSKGVVEAFKVISTTRNKTDDLYHVDAEVVVSTAKFHSRILSRQSGSRLDGSAVADELIQAKELLRSQQQRLQQSTQLLLYVLGNLERAVDTKVKKASVVKRGGVVDAVVEVDTSISVPAAATLCKAVNGFADDLAAVSDPSEGSPSRQRAEAAAAGSLNRMILGLVNRDSHAGARSRASGRDANLVIDVPKTGCFIAGRSSHYSVPDTAIAEMIERTRQLGICLSFIDADGFELFRSFYGVDTSAGNFPIDTSFGRPLIGGTTSYAAHLSISEVPDEVLRASKEFRAKVTLSDHCL